jgi:biotin synthase
VLRQYIDEKVRLRGLLEFSNRCACNCRYCGIRSSAPIARFTLSEEEVLEVARVSRDAGYGSMTLQSGERSDRAFTDYVERLVRRIKRETVTSELPRGLGVTLCVGEQSRETFRRFFDAGAHRYLLRIETSDPELFRRLHPPDQPLERRLAALSALKETGFQLGTGVMIGIPGQTAEHLARDIAFFGEVDADMIGMGPYIESAGVADPALDPPLGVAERLRLSLRMIAATRIYLRDVNIAATTALQALSPTGREAGLAAGANVLMPIMTPGSRRADYQLYAGKPCVTEDSVACSACTPFRAARAARGVLWNDWGDAPHAKGAVP